MLLTSSKRQAVSDLLQLGGKVDQKTSLALWIWHVATLKLLVDSLLEKVFLLRVACHFHHLVKCTNL